MTNNNSNVPFSVQLFAGAIAGISEISVMYPLDVVKTRLQLQKGKGEYRTIMGTLASIVRAEGIGKLYRGIVAPILVEAPKRSTKFAANEQYTVIMKSFTGTESLTQLQSIATGIGAGITEAFVVVAFELVKIRMQDKANAEKYKSTFDCAVKVFKNEGILSFFTGLESTIWRHAFWNGGYFGTIFSFRQYFPIRSDAGSLEKLKSNFISGALGGVVGTILNTPFDVVKTRIQNASSSSQNVSRPWTLSVMRNLVHEEGYLALYKGFVPKVLRLGPGGGILLVVFNGVIEAIKMSGFY